MKILHWRTLSFQKELTVKRVLGSDSDYPVWSKLVWVSGELLKVVKVVKDDLGSFLLFLLLYKFIMVCNRRSLVQM